MSDSPRLEPVFTRSNFDGSGEYQPFQGEKGIPIEMGHMWRLVPALGTIVWKLPEALAAIVTFRAYICQLTDGRQIGYVRIPHYNFDEGTAKAFEDLIARFENATAAMVLDQMNNPGGNMYQMYAILSTLTERALTLPTHQLRLTEDDVAIAADTVALAAAGEAVPPDERPPRELVAYSRFVLSEVREGRGIVGKGQEMTRPVYLFGIEKIMPAKNHYTKKLIVLINSTTFSAGEFLAAILQDNKRAVLFGTNTAGAGGCVSRIGLKGPDGQDMWLTLPWTVAKRSNGQLIQRIGVEPDIKYSVTREDIISGYAGYRKALLAAISSNSDDQLR